MNKNLETTLSFLDEKFPNAGCELEYTTDYSFLIAVMLSAQTTDKKVNSVTRVLFSKYPTLNDLVNAPISEIENILKPLGLYKNKAQHVHLIALDLLEKFNCKVPTNKSDLITLSGVGNKTANVVRAELFKAPEFPVDTHVSRICKRLGFANPDDDVMEIEKKMRKLLPEERYIKTHHQLIHFGRYFCKAQKPNCDECKLTSFCKDYQK